MICHVGQLQSELGKITHIINIHSTRWPITIPIWPSLEVTPISPFLVNFESQIKMVNLESLFMMLSPDFQRIGGESPLGIKYTQEERHRMANE